MPGRARFLAGVLALVFVVLLGACSATATVTVQMHDDGAGVVSVRVALDAAAVRAAEVGGGKLSERVRTADLTAAGWTVSPWRRTRSGAVLTVRTRFTRPEQIAPIVREINGPDGPLRGFTASRDGGTLSTSYRLTGGVDLRSIRLGIADDPDLVTKLTGERVDVAAVEQRIVASALGALRVRAHLEVPGSSRTITVSPGHRAAAVATSDETDVGRVALVLAGIAIGAVALVVLVRGERRARRRRGRRSVRSAP
jgi:hypothetical protein